MDSAEKASLKDTFKLVAGTTSLGTVLGGSLAYVASGSPVIAAIYATICGGIPAMGGLLAIALTSYAIRQVQREQAKMEVQDRIQDDDFQSSIVNPHL